MITESINNINRHQNLKGMSSSRLAQFLADHNPCNYNSTELLLLLVIVKRAIEPDVPKEVLTTLFSGHTQYYYTYRQGTTFKMVEYKEVDFRYYQ